MLMKKNITILILILFPFLLDAQDTLPKYIITTGKLPQLAYSTGEDRLGSAKMGYIDTSVVLKVLDTVKNLYKVQLSSMHFAFIEKSYAMPYPDTVLSTALCESWRVKGGEKHDSVSFSLNGRVPYKSWMEINPSRIRIVLLAPKNTVFVVYGGILLPHHHHLYFLLH